MLCCRGIQSTPGKTAAMDGVISAIIIKTKINYDGVAWEHSIINQYSFEMDDNPPSPKTNISSSLKVLIVAAMPLLLMHHWVFFLPCTDGTPPILFLGIIMQSESFFLINFIYLPEPDTVNNAI